MEDNLEIYFCEICSESIPAKDLTAREAIEVKGKVIGPCCLGEFPKAPARSGMSAAGLTTVGAVLLAAIAGSTMYLEWRQAEQAKLLEGKIQSVSSRVASDSSRQFIDLEKGLDKTIRAEDLVPIEKKIESLAAKMTVQGDQLAAKIGGLGARLGGLDEAQKSILAGQSAVKVAVKDVENEVLRLEREVATAVATPRPVEAVADVPEPKPRVEAGEEAAPALPASLNHQVTRLKDGEAGNRFEAVDHLVQSKDPAVLPYLLPMLKDPDAFVRRLTAEGLAGFRDQTTVDGLLVALADPESIVRHTAHASLRKLTKQTIAFDPDGSSSSRASAQRRWKDWWDKNRASF